MKISVPCSFCGKVIERKESQILRSKSGRLFCNNACRIAYEKKYGNCNRGKRISRGYKKTPESLSASA